MLVKNDPVAEARCISAAMAFCAPPMEGLRAELTIDAGRAASNGALLYS
jgi:hypothetical protein